MNFSIVTNNFGLYLEGLLTTVQLTVFSVAIGLMLAIPLAVLRTSKNRFISMPIRAYVYFFRGTPLLIQMFLIYYGLGQFEAFRNTFFWVFFQEAYFCALLALTLNTGAYTCEIIRGAIESTPLGEIEAAKSVGMSKMLNLRRIILPSAFRRALPAYGNEVVFMLHATSLTSLITILDLTGAAKIIYTRYYSPYEAYLTSALFYLCLVSLTVWMFKKIERKVYFHLKRS